MDVRTLKIWTTLYAAGAKGEYSMSHNTLAELTGYRAEELIAPLAELAMQSYVRDRHERDKDIDQVWLTEQGVQAFEDYVAELRRVAGS